MRSTRFAIFALILFSAIPARGEIVLYDGSPTPTTTPSAQGWRYLTDPLLNASAVQSTAPGVTILDTTTQITDKAGYFSEAPILGQHPLMPVLNRSSGFTIRFQVQIDQESHVKNDRSGFDLIVLSEDLKGIELGFWTDSIFALNDDVPSFSRGEDVAFDTTSMTSYELSVDQGGYTLYAGGIAAISGLLRDYSSFGFPYNTPSFLFLGDDTTSASAIRTGQGRGEPRSRPGAGQSLP